MNPVESKTVSAKKKHVQIVEPLPESYGSPVRRTTYVVEGYEEILKLDTLVLSSAHDTNPSTGVEDGATVGNIGNDNANALQLNNHILTTGQTPANQREIGHVMDSAQAVLENLQRELYGGSRAEESPMKQYQSSVNSSIVAEVAQRYG